MGLWDKSSVSVECHFAVSLTSASFPDLAWRNDSVCTRVGVLSRKRERLRAWNCQDRFKFPVIGVRETMNASESTAVFSGLADFETSEAFLLQRAEICTIEILVRSGPSIRRLFAVP